jgi:hypothetical protein
MAWFVLFTLVSLYGVHAWWCAEVLCYRDWSIGIQRVMHDDVDVERWQADEVWHVPQFDDATNFIWPRKRELLDEVVNWKVDGF